MRLSVPDVCYPKHTYKHTHTNTHRHTYTYTHRVTDSFKRPLISAKS